jgi:hypothetical protein
MLHPEQLAKIDPTRGYEVTDFFLREQDPNAVPVGEAIVRAMRAAATQAYSKEA